MLPARRDLTLLLTDLYLDAELRASAGEAAAPALQGLELALARASAREAVDWRELALRLVGAPPLAPVPVAALSRAAHDLGESTGQWWVASAVELEAAHDHVQLAQVLSLEDEEWERLIAGFNAAFGADGCELELGQGAEAYLRFGEPAVACAVDPARIVGGDVHDALPVGPQGALLRRLMTEAQMWLHEHPLNVERIARGQAPVTGLWFWGGGELPARPQSSSLPALVSTDRFLRGLWRWAGADAANVEPSLAAALGASGERGCVAAVAMREERGDSWAERLAAFDSDWLMPAIAALRAGRIDVLRVQASDALFTLRGVDLWRIWRRPRPWLEALA